MSNPDLPILKQLIEEVKLFGSGSGSNHSHENKTTLDKITESKLTSWDSKSNFDGNYNNLTNKPIIPSEYTLPIATASTLGGIKVGTGLSITEGVLSATGGGTADSVNHKLSGVKWGCLGDSITDNNNAPVNAHYDKVICDYTGAINYNYGVLSTTVAIRAGRNDSMLERVETMASDLDIITVLGGTNDFGAATNVPIGTFGNGDNTTFYGAYEELILKLINKYPNKSIGLITPIQRGYTLGTGLDTYRQAILKLGEKYCIPVLDLWKESGLCSSVDSINNAYFIINDRLHPNAEGQKIIARPILSFLEKIYYNFDVLPPQTINVIGITLDKSTVTVSTGSTETLITTISPSNATNKNVTWKSSNTNIATVNNGIVSGVSNGNCTITVTTTDGNKIATCDVTVKIGTSSVASVSLDKTTHTLNVGETVQLNATVSPTDSSNKNVTWNSSDDTKATVINGLVTAKAEGSCVITVTTVDGNKSATCNIVINAESSFTNLYIKENNSIGGINTSTGEAETTAGTWVLTDFISKHPTKKIKTNVVALKSITSLPYFLFTYDSNKTYLGAINGLGQSEVVNAGSGYIRFNIHNSCVDKLEVWYE